MPHIIPSQTASHDRRSAARRAAARLEAEKRVELAAIRSNRRIARTLAAFHLSALLLLVLLLGACAAASLAGLMWRIRVAPSPADAVGLVEALTSAASTLFGVLVLKLSGRLHRVESRFLCDERRFTRALGLVTLCRTHDELKRLLRDYPDAFERGAGAPEPRQSPDPEDAESG